MYTTLFCGLAAVGCFTALSLTAQENPVPTSLALVSAIDQTPTITVTNTGQRPITAFVVRRVTAPGQLLITNDSTDAPIQSGQSRTVMGSHTPEWENLTTHDVQIDGIIFSDGKWFGDGKELQELIFDRRQAEAQVLAEWRDVIQHLPADDSQAISAFLAKTDSIKLKGYGKGTADAAREQFLAGIKNVADEIRKMQGSSSANQIRHQKLDWISPAATKYAATAINAGRAAVQQ